MIQNDPDVVAYIERNWPDTRRHRYKPLIALMDDTKHEPSWQGDLHPELIAWVSFDSE